MASVLFLGSNASLAGDYHWTIGEGSSGNTALALLNGTIYESDIPGDQIKDICASGYNCSLYLESQTCNGTVNSATNNINGIVGRDTPVTYLEKIGWRVNNLRVMTCTTHEVPTRLLLYGYRTATGSVRNVILASTDGSGGGTLPPPKPAPLSCSFSSSSGGTIDWGTLSLDELNVGKLAEAPNAARVTCSGDGIATAKLTFKSIDGSGDIAKMKNNSGDVIPAKLIISNESNSVSFQVQDGYNVARTLYAKIQPYNISTYGEYKGSALLTLEIL